MVKAEKGMLARSLAGHDQNRLYIIIRAEEEYVWLADGRLRTLEKPKKKKRKHVQIHHKIPEPVNSILKSEKTLRDEEIKQAIQSESRRRQEDKDVKSRCN